MDSPNGEHTATIVTAQAGSASIYNTATFGDIGGSADHEPVSDAAQRLVKADETNTDEEEIRASSLQFGRKLSGFTKTSKANEVAFDRAVDQVAQTLRELLDALVTKGPSRDRDVEAARARARAATRVPAS